MAEKTAIAWTDATFNPWWGCEAVSPGCEHCYAEAMVKRLGRNFAERERTSEANWEEPLRWNRKAQRAGKPTRVFCASMADVFDNQVPEAWRVDLFNLIAATPWLQWQLLTKRIGNVLAYKLPANVWLGITVVTQAEADRDIPKLLEVPATKRFLSCEPLLEPITIPGFDQTSWCPICRAIVADSLAEPHEGVHGVNCFAEFDAAKHCIDVPALLDWVIVGGESGPLARPFALDWARSLRDQCAHAGVAFFMKQMGRRPQGVHYIDRAGADPSEWPTDLRVQEFPQ